MYYQLHIFKFFNLEIFVICTRPRNHDLSQDNEHIHRLQKLSMWPFVICTFWPRKTLVRFLSLCIWRTSKKAYESNHAVAWFCYCCGCSCCCCCFGWAEALIVSFTIIILRLEHAVYLFSLLCRIPQDI